MVANLKTNCRDFRYIIDVVDAFSRKVWLEKMRVKSALVTAREFAKICERCLSFLFAER